MKRLVAFITCLVLPFGLTLDAAEYPSTEQSMTFSSAAELEAAGMDAPLLAMAMMKEIVCEEGSRLNLVTRRSGTIECCNMKDRVKAALDVMKEVVYGISDKCAEDGCELSAIARICVNFESVSDGKCVAVVSAWYVCCCCIVKEPLLEGCKIDEELCSSTVRKATKGRKYECCDIDDRWNTIYGTILDAVGEAREYCAQLECATPIGIRGMQVDFGVVDEAEGICAVESTVLYSCCCPCAY